MEPTPPVPSPSPDAPSLPDEPIPTRGSFQRPADYYSAPPPRPTPGKGGCSGRAPLTCGAIGCGFLILLFVGGALLMRAGGGKLFDFAFGFLEGEASKAMTASVTPEQRSSFEQEFGLLRRNVERKLIGAPSLQPFFSNFVEATRDSALSPEEVDDLTERMKTLNDEAAQKLKRETGPRA